MRGTACVWDRIVGQEKAVSLLRRSAAGSLVSHAYLFVGGPGVGKKTAARALSCAVMCEDGGCGGCDTCARIQREVHPDVHIIEPEGAASYIVSQVRDVIRDVELTPVEGPRKVYVLTQADSLNAEAANALLKTLEEPPDDAVLILLALSADSVLPTISSRCQVVRFERISRADALAAVVERTGVDEDTALAALAAAGGILPRAIEIVRSPSRMAVREEIMATLKDVAAMDPLDVLEAVKRIMLSVRAPLDDLRRRQEEDLEKRRELMGKASTTKPIEEKHKRETTAREREGLFEVLDVTESWLRDCLMLSRGADELIGNRDHSDATAEVAAVISAHAATDALAAVGRARKRISYNVSPQLALEAMIFDIREVLRCPR